MKSIETLGGPLIALPLESASSWRGNTGKGFIGPECPFADDYEAAGYAKGLADETPWSTALLKGREAQGLVFREPWELHLIAEGNGNVITAQVITFDGDIENFDYSDALEYSTSKQTIDFYCERPTIYILFDSVLAFDEVGDQCLRFAVSAGNNQLSSDLCIYGQNTATVFRIYNVDRSMADG